MNYFDLPKIDLHCHLDGSVRPQTIIDLADEQNLTLPSRDINVIKEMMVAPETCPNLDEYLKRFELPGMVMQTAEALERISFELFEDAANENVKYLEVRFGPLLHQVKGLSLEEIMDSVVRGMKRAEAQYDIHGNYILSILRTMPKDQIKAVLEAGAKHLNDGIVAFDLAGSEVPGFCHEFVPYAQYAKELGYRITIHAGEQGAGQNVYDAISLLGAERVGHGIFIHNHPEAYQLVKGEEVALETCPSSNVQTKAVNSLSEHPIKAFYKDGIAVTINTDNRTVSNTTMTDEVRKVVEAFELTEAEYFDIYTISVNNAFTSDAVKQHLLSFAQ
ncbi:TPA: adenosine deaminase [Vibrio vulnificus]|uniref:Adenosine deaminase n=1 Tax=Vibrio vulnificus TaxID=672 RepID=A0ABX4X492_VIBVL|nr:adenosine deaminase [Vibrio vulnificus]EGQ7999865.1 adenosine deaminase [Vibrio vulnificus]EGQ9938264.1 adenosine deaminase [Vibrio vulnificus]EGQ9972419.1 adenosine deaminase [Vibrio vulnificus]EGR0052382.1 adenosine deaminase [Vibrio vulnificus]EID4339679.1 adenosine deaminase [Vibrio vulnificus]